MRVKIKFEYEKDADLPEDEFYKLGQQAIWLAGVIRAIEHIEYLPRWEIRKIESNKETNEQNDL